MNEKVRIEQNAKNTTVHTADDVEQMEVLFNPNNTINKLTILFKTPYPINTEGNPNREIVKGYELKTEE